MGGGEAQHRIMKKTPFAYDGMIGVDKRNSGILDYLKRNGIIKSFVLVLCTKQKQYMEKSVGYIIFGKPAFLQYAKDLKWTKMILNRY